MRTQEFTNHKAHDSDLNEEEITEYSYTAPEIKVLLKKKGYRFLGKGVDQSAYLAPNGRAVLKIFGTESGTGQRRFTPDQKMFLTWANFCAKNPNNPFLPKFLPGEGGKPWAPFIFDKDHYLQIWQERLYRIPNRPWGEELEDLSHLVRLRGFDRLRQQWQLDPNHDHTDRHGHTVEFFVRRLGEEQTWLLIKTIDQLERIADQRGYDLDLHGNNFMQRQNKQIVIVDPWVV